MKKIIYAAIAAVIGLVTLIAALFVKSTLLLFVPGFCSILILGLLLDYGKDKVTV